MHAFLKAETLFFLSICGMFRYSQQQQQNSVLKSFVEMIKNAGWQGKVLNVQIGKNEYA